MTPRLASSPPARAAALGCFIALAAASVLAAREVALGRTQLEAADDDAQRGEWAEAIAHLRAAAEARAPGSPWPHRAAARLEELAHAAEARRDDDTALLAYGALRAAALSTRTLGSSRASWRHEAEEGVARIADRQRAASGAHDAHERAASVRETLQREDTPAMWKLAAMTCAALAMVGGLSRLAYRGGDGGWAGAAGAVALAGLALYAAVLLMN
jgi:hypothetical protein